MTSVYALPPFTRRQDQQQPEQHIGGYHQRTITEESNEKHALKTQQQVQDGRNQVRELLVSASSLPCSTAAHTFTQLVQPTARFQLALEALLPILDRTNDIGSVLGEELNEVEQRILASFILFFLYAPYPVTLNPFKSVLVGAFTREKERALHAGNGNDQLVWVLWKILKGDGNDIGPYSPNTLARSPIPLKLRAVNLSLDTELYSTDIDMTATTEKQPHNNDTSAFLADKAGLTTSHSAASDISSQANDTTGSTSCNSSYLSPQHDVEFAMFSSALNLFLAGRTRSLNLREQKQVSDLLDVIEHRDDQEAYADTTHHKTWLRLMTELYNDQGGRSQFDDISKVDGMSENDLFSIGRGGEKEKDWFFGGIIVGSDIAAFIEHNPSDLARRFVVAYLFTYNYQPVLDVLKHLPPTLPCLDVLGRLLQDDSTLRSSSIGKNPFTNESYTVKTLIRLEVLGPFVSSAIRWLEDAEKEEREGRVSDDRFEKGVVNLCRFYTSLIKLGLIAVNAPGGHDEGSDYVNMAEMMHFSLQHSRLQEANVLYRVLCHPHILHTSNA